MENNSVIRNGSIARNGLTKRAIRDAESRIIACEHALLKEDLLKIILALFEKKDVSDRLFPVLAKVFENGILEIRMLVLILFLMAIKRRKDITSTIPVLQEAFIENWERPGNSIPFSDWWKIDKLLKRPSSEYNELLASVLTRHFVLQKNPEMIFALLDRHFNHINRVHGIWFSVPHNQKTFSNIYQALCQRCLNPGPED